MLSFLSHLSLCVTVFFADEISYDFLKIYMYYQKISTSIYGLSSVSCSSDLRTCSFGPVRRLLSTSSFSAPSSRLIEICRPLLPSHGIETWSLPHSVWRWNRRMLRMQRFSSLSGLFSIANHAAARFFPDFRSFTKVRAVESMLSGLFRKV